MNAEELKAYLDAMPVDDEPISEASLTQLRAAKAARDRGERDGMTTAELCAELGIPMPTMR